MGIHEVITMYKGIQESGYLGIAVLPKKMEDVGGKGDNLDFAIGAMGNPYAIADALLRKCGSDPVFSRFFEEVMRAMALAETEEFEGYKKPFGGSGGFPKTSQN